MRTPILSILLILVGLLAAGFGCSPSTKVAGNGGPAYPIAIKDSTERRDHAERDWKRLLDAYGVPQTDPDLYPVTWAPKSLSAIQNGIKIMTSKAAKETQASALREAAKSFVQRWHDLTVAEPSGVSLADESQAGGLTRLTYNEMSYPFPIAGDLGKMTLTLSADGSLRQMDDRFIPVVDFPSRPTIDRDTAISAIAGHTVAALDSAGKAAQIKVGAKSDVTSARLVIVPMASKGEIDLHLAWQLGGTKPSQWTAYVDAVQGGILNPRQAAQP